MTQVMNVGFEVKSLNEEGVFEGYASVFHVTDQGRDAVAPGAFERSIKERGADGVKLLWQHDPKEPIGVIEELREDAKGLYMRARLMLNVRRAEEALSLMKKGVLDGLSIGFKTLLSEKSDDGVRILKDVDLWEVSLVTFPMNPAARVGSFKSADMTERGFENFLRDAGGFSRSEAKVITAQGFKTIMSQRDADEDWTIVLDAIQDLDLKLKSLKGDHA